MQRLFVRADRHLYVGIGLLELKERGKDLVIGNILPVNISSVAARHLNMHEGEIGRLNLSNRRGKIDPDAFHVRLAQTHHHEAGEEKEHDVDQRNDLDARSFFRNG